MAKKPDIASAQPLGSYYEEAIVASGLADDVVDIIGLAPRPYRYAEGEFICRHGDPSECLWIIVTGSVAVREQNRTLFVRRRGQVVGEQHLLGNGYQRLFDLVANEGTVELLVIEKASIEAHEEKDVIWRNVAKIVSLKLRDASIKASSLSRQLEDDTRILHAYTNEYALSRRPNRAEDALPTTRLIGRSSGFPMSSTSAGMLSSWSPHARQILFSGFSTPSRYPSPRMGVTLISSLAMA